MTKRTTLFIGLFAFALTSITLPAIYAKREFAYPRSAVRVPAHWLPSAGAPLAAQNQSVTYNDVLTGDEMSAVGPDAITLAGEAKADASGNALPGHYTITIRFNRATRTVIGGDWVLTVTATNAAGTLGEASALQGTVADGRVTLNDAGRVTAIVGIKLIVAGGHGDYGNLTGGNGSFEGTFNEKSTGDPQTPPQVVHERNMSPPSNSAAEAAPPFNGKLSLTF